MTVQREYTNRLCQPGIDAISRITKIIDDPQPVEQNYPEILAVIKDALKADRVALLLANPQGVFCFQSSIGLSTQYQAAVEGHSPWTSLTLNPQTICVSDVNSEPEMESYRSVILEEGIRALAFVPLLYRQKLLGKFMVYHNNPHDFTDSEVQLVETIAGLFGFAMEHKQIEQTLRSESQQRELFMKEIHHRIKNNLQIVVSLLALQANQSEQKLRSVLKDCENRVRSMAIIHEKLYNSSNFSSVDLGSYLRELSNSLFSSYGSNGNVSIQVRCQSVEADVDRALYCGLLLNEILSNSLKHGFQKEIPGEILVNFQQNCDGKFQLLVKDSGPGIPEHVQLSNGSSLGLRLVSMLVAQLKGEIHLDRSEGTSFRIEFA